jgi:hypothetical protein
VREHYYSQMGTFETNTHGTDFRVENLLTRLDPLTLQIATDSLQYERAKSFFATVHAPEAASVEIAGQQTSYDQPYFSAVSTAGHLFAARLRKTTPGVYNPDTAALPHYAVLEGSLDHDGMKGWLPVVSHTETANEDLELMIDGLPPADVESMDGLSVHEQVLRRLRARDDEALRISSSTRIRLGRQAWTLLLPSEAHTEFHTPLRSLSQMLDRVEQAHEDGFSEEFLRNESA